jgi:Asp-tRNA(Asn)/Glu-tRNA(Gln) amidotransferase A subunit family amidase
MTLSRLNELSAVELRAAIAKGDATCEDVARACLERVAAREKVVHAWVYIDPDAILAEARRLDAASKRGPLHGVPIGVKDVIDTYDMPTQMGSPIYRGYRPAADASCVALLRAAGALILGKTVTCEFAGVTAGETTNPHDVSRTPGGSSSGSAAAVADYMVPLAFGTQTGGSIQRPASYCGIVGYKPTYGLINTAGLKPAAVSLDTLGLMARSVDDIALAMRLLTNDGETAQLPKDIKLRIGVCRTSLWDTAEEATRHALSDAAERLRSRGDQVDEISLPEQFGALSSTREVINDYERARAMAHEWQHARGSISEGLAKSIMRGFEIPAARYVEALALIEECRRMLVPIFEHYDVLLAPAVTGEAPLGLAYTGHHGFQSIWTQLRVPTVGLPTHQGPSGLPVSVQLVGPAHADQRLIATAKLLFEFLGRGPSVRTDP